ncbi:uncharacterized protein LOC117653372 [Thrips palmi]|uniref:Gustatory receptor n=1 Tax=Thrips palmi TaxID=161013 RepID=A0A6P9AA06_THRPL|nr:uncharacterized protein LOC117653372 [Thrips palmi]
MAFLYIMWLARMVIDRWCCTVHRFALCDLARCAALYCQRHPPSRAAWATLLRTAMIIVFLFAAGLWVNTIWNEGAYPDAVSVFQVLHHVASSVALLTEMMEVLFVGPAMLLSVLIADLRKECEALIKQTRLPRPLVSLKMDSAFSNQDYAGRIKQPHNDTVEMWRSFRVRQQFLHDMTIGLNAMFALVHLVKTCHILYVASLSTSHGIIYLMLDSPAWQSYIPLLYSVLACATFVGLCCTAQMAENELALLSNGLLGFLAQKPEVSPGTKQEIELFVRSVRWQRGRFNVYGIFYLNTNTMKAVLGCISTYVVVLWQFDARMS